MKRTPTPQEKTQIINEWDFIKLKLCWSYVFITSKAIFTQTQIYDLETEGPWERKISRMGISGGRGKWI